MWRNYYSVTNLSEALEQLANYGERARIVAGGTDMIIELERGARPGVDTLIDITRIPELDTITFDQGQFTLGALVLHNHVVGNAELVQHALPLAQAAWEVGAPQIRNRATVAGNIITASPANDTIPPLLAMNASLTLNSSQGERTLALADFYQGYRQTALRPHEMLTKITFPALQSNEAGIFLKLGLRRAQAISVLNVAVILGFEDAADRRSTLTHAAIAMGCVAPTVIRLPDVETYLLGKQLTDDTIHAAARLAASIPKPIADVRSPAEYRTEMTYTYVKRALLALQSGQERATFPQNPAMLWGDHQAMVQASLPQAVRHERTSSDTITTTVNDQPYTVTGSSHKTLLRFLREDIKLTGTKEGCAEGECGACTVFLDDVAVMACMVPAPRAHGAHIVTVEGLAHTDGSLHPIQQGFVEAGAVQCGFCTPGFLMSGAKLLAENPSPNQQQIEQSISGNLCRCTGYYKILEAFERAKQLEEA